MAAFGSDDTLRLRASVTGTGRDVFIGVGPAAAVDQYLAGNAVDKVTDLDVNPFPATCCAPGRLGAARTGVVLLIVGTRMASQQRPAIPVATGPSAER